MTSSPDRPIPPEDLLAHASFVRGLARALVSEDHDVDDVVQETWLAALGASGSAIRRPRSWLASITRRRAARLHRTRASLDKRHAEAAQAPEAQSPDQLAALREIIQRVSSALATLPAHYQDALVLRYYEALPPREVARRLEIPVETARTRIRRGLARLREILDEEHEGGRAAWAMPLAGFLGSGVTGGGAGALAVGGIALAALLVLGFIFIPRVLTERSTTDAGEPSVPTAEVTAPTLEGRGEAEKREPEVVRGPSAGEPDPKIPQASPEPSVRVRVINIATRTAVPGVTLAYATRDEEQRELTVTGDASGVAGPLPRSALQSLQVKGGPWRVLPVLAPTEAETVDLYVYREVRLVVACHRESGEPLPAAGTPFEVVVRRPAAQTLSSQNPNEIGGRFWLQARGAGQDQRTATLDDQGVLRITARWFADQGVMVRGGGYWSDLVPVPSLPGSLAQEDSTPEMLVRIPLRTGYRVEATLHDVGGSPVADALVTLVVLRRVPVSEASSLKKPMGAAQTMRWRTGGEYALVQTYTSSRTDAHGRIVLTSAVNGRAFVYAHAKGYRQVSVDAPSLDQVAGTLSLEAEAVPEGSIATIFWNGTPLPPGTLMVVTMGADLQYHFYTKVMDGGRISTAWFRHGQHYYIRYSPSERAALRGHAKAEFIWTGQSELHLESLLRPRILLVPVSK